MSVVLSYPPLPSAPTLADSPSATTTAAPPPPPPLHLSDSYTLDALLSHGTWGTVWRATRTHDGAAVAVKKAVRRRGPGGGQGLAAALREAAVLRRVAHARCVRLLEVGEEPHRAAVSLVEELVPGCELLALAHGGGVGGEAARAVAEQVADALCYLHTVARVAHLDLKPENVMVSVGGGGGREGEALVGPFSVKVVDFGCAVSLEGEGGRGVVRVGMCGTVQYCAPEMLYSLVTTGSRPLSLPAASVELMDVYAYGCLVFYALEGRPAFSNEEEGGGGEGAACLLQRAEALLVTMEDPARRAASLAWRRRAGPPADATLAGVCAACLSLAPAERPGAAEVARGLGVEVRVTQAEADEAARRPGDPGATGTGVGRSGAKRRSLSPQATPLPSPQQQQHRAGSSFADGSGGGGDGGGGGGTLEAVQVVPPVESPPPTKRPRRGGE